MNDRAPQRESRFPQGGTTLNAAFLFALLNTTAPQKECCFFVIKLSDSFSAESSEFLVDVTLVNPNNNFKHSKSCKDMPD